VAKAEPCSGHRQMWPATSMGQVRGAGLDLSQGVTESSLAMDV
jgi:hypothetical protein